MHNDCRRHNGSVTDATVAGGAAATPGAAHSNALSLGPSAAQHRMSPVLVRAGMKAPDGRGRPGEQARSRFRPAFTYLLRTSSCSRPSRSHDVSSTVDSWTVTKTGETLETL